MPKKMILICIKYFVENKSSVSHHIMKEKRKKNTHPLSPTTPSHTTKNQIPWKIKKNSTLLPTKTTKLLLPMPLKNQPLEIVPSTKQNHFSHSHPKISFESGWNYSILPSSPKNNAFEKKLLSHHPFFLKLHFLQFIK